MITKTSHLLNLFLIIRNNGIGGGGYSIQFAVEEWKVYSPNCCRHRNPRDGDLLISRTCECAIFCALELCRGDYIKGILMGRVSHGTDFPGGPNANTSTFKGVIGRGVMTEAEVREVRRPHRRLEMKVPQTKECRWPVEGLSLAPPCNETPSSYPCFPLSFISILFGKVH